MAHNRRREKDHAAPAANPAAAAVVAGCDAPCRETLATCTIEAKCPAESVPLYFPRPGQDRGPIAGITAERDEYVAVPWRPATVEAAGQELSHAEAFAGITAERDEYVAVPWRPATVEAAGQELSHAGAIAGITAERDEYVAVPPRAATVETPDQNCPTGSKAWAPRWSVKSTLFHVQARRQSVMSTRVSHGGRARSRRRTKTVPSEAKGGRRGGA